MNVHTYDALQSVKYELFSCNKSAIQYFKKEDYLHSPIDRQLCLNVKSAAKMYKDKKNWKQDLKKDKALTDLCQKEEK